MRFPLGSQTLKVAMMLAISCLIFSENSTRANPIQWAFEEGGNGHWYEAVPCGVCNWHEAADLAAAMTWQGWTGHLATLTTLEENNWVWTNVGSESYWIGAYQADNSDEPAGGWAWITGEDWAFENWGPGEPNDYQGLEDWAEFMQYEQGLWNDEYWNFPDVEDPGFVVEFGPLETPAGPRSISTIKRGY